MKTLISFLLWLLVTIGIELPTLMLYFDKNIDPLNVWAILALLIVSIFAQTTAKKACDWFENKY